MEAGTDKSLPKQGRNPEILSPIRVLAGAMENLGETQPSRDLERHQVEFRILDALAAASRLRESQPGQPATRVLVAKMNVVPAEISGIPTKAFLRLLSGPPHSKLGPWGYDDIAVCFTLAARASQQESLPIQLAGIAIMDKDSSTALYSEAMRDPNRIIDLAEMVNSGSIKQADGSEAMLLPGPRAIFLANNRFGGLLKAPFATQDFPQPKQGK